MANSRRRLLAPVHVWTDRHRPTIGPAWHGRRSQAVRAAPACAAGRQKSGRSRRLRGRNGTLRSPARSCRPIQACGAKARHCIRGRLVNGRLFLFIFGHVRPLLNPWPSWPAGSVRALAGLPPRHGRDDLARDLHRRGLRQVHTRGEAVAAHTGVGGATSCGRLVDGRRGAGGGVQAQHKLAWIARHAGGPRAPLRAGAARGRSDSRTVVELEGILPLTVLNHLANHRLENVRAA